MATDKHTLKLVGLDFDTLKASLVEYLQTQEQFKDYDYSGSNLNVLLDLLAYNTAKNAFYLNMVASESFLDSAQLRESVISHAKQVNYMPRSARSSHAVINYNFTNTAVKVITIPKGTTFTSTVGFNLMTFMTAENKTVSSSDGEFDFNLDIYEGQYVTDSFVIDDTINEPRYVLSNETIDTSSITVTVYENDGNKIFNYTESETLLDLDSTSQVYFIQAAEKGKYEILFGNDVIGRKPKNRAIVTVNYRITRGEEGNGASAFTLAEDITGLRSARPTVPVRNGYTSSTGGAGPETIESIKFNAPRHYQLQERAITTSDYEILMTQKFPEISSVSVYGGEELSPPKYGKVYVAVDIAEVDGLPSSKKDEYYNYLKTRSPLSIDPVIVEPEMLYYQVDSLVNYNVNLTDKSKEDIKAEVVESVKAFNTLYLNKFKGVLRYSKLVSAIDDTDPSIVSNETEIQIYKKITPRLGVSQNFVVNFKIPLQDDIALLTANHKASDKHTIASSSFIYKGERVKFGDDGDGRITIVKTVGDRHIVIDRVGRVNYDTGRVNINNVVIDSFSGNYLKIYAVTRRKDITSRQNTVFTVENDEINIRVREIRE